MTSVGLQSAQSRTPLWLQAAVPEEAAWARTSLPALSAVLFFAAESCPVSPCRTPSLTVVPLPQWPDFFLPSTELSLLMNAQERLQAAAAHSACLLYSDQEPSSAQARMSFVETVCRLGADACATVLPAARKAIGRTAIQHLASLEMAAREEALLLQLHTVMDGESAWVHSHGMAYFGLCDVECFCPASQKAVTLRLVQSAIAQLRASGMASMRPGQMLEVEEADGRSLARFTLREAESAAGHDYDAWGCLRLDVQWPETGDRTFPSESIMEAREALRAYISSRRRASDLVYQGSDLGGAELSNLVADRVDLSGADLTGSDLRSARLGGCMLREVRMDSSTWTDAVLRVCNMDGVRARCANFDRARIEDGTAKAADMRGASLREACLSESDFERAILREAVLDGASGDGTVFRGADLGNASFKNVKFEDADFRGADLRNADLSGGRFFNADFRGALLDGVDFENTDCEGARFDADRQHDQSVHAGPAQGAALDERFREIESTMEDLARLLETGGAAAQNPALVRLFSRAGITSGEAPSPQHAAMLRRLLTELRGLKQPGEQPEALVNRCRAVLESVLPELGDTLGEADWRSLEEILAHTASAQSRSTVSGTDPAAPAAEDR